MHRVDAANHSNNTFRNKDAVNGIPGTKLEADWHNSVQEELANVVEAAGIVLDKAKDDQLLAAIRILFAGQLPSPTLANNGLDALHDIDVAAGSIIDEARTAVITLGAITKRLDAAWAAGTNQGGRAAGVSLVDGSWYHVFAIAKADGTADVVFDTDATASHRDAAYTKYAWLGAVYYVDGTSGIQPFLQVGDEFLWGIPSSDVSDFVCSTAAVLHSIRVPVCSGVVATVMISMHESSGTQRHHPGLITSPLVADTAPTSTEGGDASNAYNMAVYENSSAADSVCMTISVPTATAQVRARWRYTTGSYSIVTLSWKRVR